MGMFGSMVHLKPDCGTIVFIGVLVFVLLFDGAFYVLESYCKRNEFKGLLEKLSKEFMIMGFISFGTYIGFEANNFSNNEWFDAFHFAHLVVLFVALSFMVQALLLVWMVHSRSRSLRRYAATPSELLFDQYDKLSESPSTLKHFLFHCGPVILPWPALRENIEYKIVQGYFIHSFNLPPEFNFAQYITKVLKHYMISLADVRPINWLILCILVAVNYGRIKILDTEESGGISCTHHDFEPDSHRHDECVTYYLEFSFFCEMMIVLFNVILVIISEIYMQRLLNKVVEWEVGLEKEEILDKKKQEEAVLVQMHDLYSSWDYFNSSSPSPQPGSGSQQHNNSPAPRIDENHGHAEAHRPAQSPKISNTIVKSLADVDFRSMDQETSGRERRNSVGSDAGSVIDMYSSRLRGSGEYSFLSSHASAAAEHRLMYLRCLYRIWQTEASHHEELAHRSSIVDSTTTKPRSNSVSSLENLKTRYRSGSVSSVNAKSLFAKASSVKSQTANSKKKLKRSYSVEFFDFMTIVPPGPVAANAPVALSTNDVPSMEVAPSDTNKESWRMRFFKTWHRFSSKLQSIFSERADDELGEDVRGVAMPSKRFSLVRWVWRALMFHHGDPPRKTKLADASIAAKHDELSSIFFFGRSLAYYHAVEFSMLMQCVDLSLWATNLFYIANKDSKQWQVLLTVPIIVNFVLLRQVLYLACILKSVTTLDVKISSGICEQALEERNVTHRLRKTIRSLLHSLDLEKKDWQTFLSMQFGLFESVSDSGVSVKQFYAFLHSIQVHLKKPSVKRLFAMIDSDKDGLITWHDLSGIVFPELSRKKRHKQSTKSNELHAHGLAKLRHRASIASTHPTDLRDSLGPTDSMSYMDHKHSEHSDDDEESSSSRSSSSNSSGHENSTSEYSEEEEEEEKEKEEGEDEGEDNDQIHLHLELPSISSRDNLVQAESESMHRLHGDGDGNQGRGIEMSPYRRRNLSSSSGQPRKQTVVRSHSHRRRHTKGDGSEEEDGVQQHGRERSHRMPLMSSLASPKNLDYHSLSAMDMFQGGIGEDYGVGIDYDSDMDTVVEHDAPQEKPSEVKSQLDRQVQDILADDSSAQQAHSHPENDFKPQFMMDI